MSEEPLTRVTATIPESHASVLRELGNGNVSAGVRRLVDERFSTVTPENGVISTRYAE